MISLILAAAITARPHVQKCGIERWSVKVLADTDAVSVNRAVSTTTLGALNAFPSICNADSAAVRGLGSDSVEFTVFSIPARINCAKIESDGDIHICLIDSNGGKMIAESPNAACIPASSYHNELVNVRKKLANLAGVRVITKDNVKTLVNLNVLITGVGFYDRSHGQAGMAPNCMELHPIIDIVEQ